MNNVLEDKKKEIKLKLETELYVERFDSFKESVTLINEALKSFNINYQYTYDDFCKDFTNECLDFIDNYPNVDMTDPQKIVYYTLPIVMSIVEKAKIKYGNIDD